MKQKDKPKFALVMGGVGSGKTTIIKEKFTDKYVYLDGSEIFRQINEASATPVSADSFMDFMEKIEFTGQALADKIFRDKHSVVMEFIGDDQGEMTELIDAVSAFGYSVELTFVDTEPIEAYNRHLKAVEEDDQYISSYYFQDLHRKWVLNAIKR